MESSLKAIQVKLKLFLKNLEFAISLCSAYHPPFAVTGALPKQPSSSLSSFMTLTLSWIYSAPPFITFITLRWSKWSTMLPDASLRYNRDVLANICILFSIGLFGKEELEFWFGEVLPPQPDIKLSTLARYQLIQKQAHPP